MPLFTPLTTPPTAPDRTQPLTFPTRADALVAWWSTFVTEMNAAIADINGKVGLDPINGYSDGAAGSPSVYFSSDTDTGLFRAAANNIGFSVGGVEEVRIAVTGVRIGYVAGLITGVGGNPGLQVEALDAGSNISSKRDGADTIGPVLALGKSRAASLGGYTIVSAGDFLGNIYFYGADGTTMSPGARIASTAQGTPASGDVRGDLRLYTGASGGSPAEAVRITIDQDMGIGVTGPSCKLQVDGPVRVRSYTVGTLPSAATVGAGAIAWCSNEVGGSVLVTSNGSVWKRAGTQTTAS